jgi:hypothetical protein
VDRPERPGNSYRWRRKHGRSVIMNDGLSTHCRAVSASHKSAQSNAGKRGTANFQGALLFPGVRELLLP